MDLFSSDVIVSLKRYGGNNNQMLMDGDRGECCDCDEKWECNVNVCIPVEQTDFKL